jgi:hypothetical protein
MGETPATATPEPTRRRGGGSVRRVSGSHAPEATLPQPSRPNKKTSRQHSPRGDSSVIAPRWRGLRAYATHAHTHTRARTHTHDGARAQRRVRPNSPPAGMTLTVARPMWRVAVAARAAAPATASTASTASAASATAATAAAAMTVLSSHYQQHMANGTSASRGDGTFPRQRCPEVFVSSPPPPPPPSTPVATHTHTHTWSRARPIHLQHSLTTIAPRLLRFGVDHH